MRILGRRREARRQVLAAERLAMQLVGLAAAVERNTAALHSLTAATAEATSATAGGAITYTFAGRDLVAIESES